MKNEPNQDPKAKQKLVDSMVEGKHYLTQDKLKNLTFAGAEYLSKAFNWRVETYDQEFINASANHSQAGQQVIVRVRLLDQNDQSVGLGNATRALVEDSYLIATSLQKAFKSAYINAVLEASDLVASNFIKEQPSKLVLDANQQLDALEETISLLRVYKNNLDESFKQLIKSNFTNEVEPAVYLIQEESDLEVAGNSNQDSSLWMLKLGEEVVGWAHCTIYFDYLNLLKDHPGCSIANIELNHSYIKPEIRNPQLLDRFALELGMAASLHLPVNYFDKEIAEVDMGIPLDLIIHARCTSPAGRLFIDAFIEGAKRGIWQACENTLYMLNEVCEEQVIEDYPIEDWHY